MSYSRRQRTVCTDDRRDDNEVAVETRKPTRPNVSRTICLQQVSKSNFGVVWRWPLTSWVSKLIVWSFYLLIQQSADQLLWQLVAKSVHSVIRFQNIVLTRLATNERTEGQMKDQVENIMSMSKLGLLITGQPAITPLHPYTHSIRWT